MRVLLLLGCAVGLAGCMSYQAVRDSAPYKTVVVDGQPSKIADCYIDKSLLGGAPQLQKTELSGSVHVIAKQPPMLLNPGFVLYDITLKPLSGASTQIELRRVPSFIHDSGAKSIMESIEGCASKT